MNVIYPRLTRAHLPAMVRITLAGGMSGGFYGVLHDSITYRISNEYFTRMKFDQFAYMNAGLAPEWFAAQIGFVAAGVIGLAAGWFIARTTVPRWPPASASRMAAGAFLITALTSFLAAVAGDQLALHTRLGGLLWNDLSESLGITQTSAFLRVGLIHSAGYVGALTGLVISILFLRRMKPQP